MGAKKGQGRRGRRGRGESGAGRRAGEGLRAGQTGDGEAGGPGAAQVPPCAICRQRAKTIGFRFLTHGVGVWLCTAHDSVEFMRREGGGEFVRRLSRAWSASDALGFRRRAALATHIHRLRGATEDRDKPGSHTWPRLRREAERRFAAGETPALVIDELRRSHDDGPAIVPSIRSMRRWFAQGRWLVPSLNVEPRRRQQPPPDLGGSHHTDRASENPGERTPLRE